MRRRRAPRRRRRRCPFPSSALSPRTRQDHKLAPSSRLLARSPPALACRTGTGQKSTKKIADFFLCVLRLWQLDEVKRTRGERVEDGTAQRDKPLFQVSSALCCNILCRRINVFTPIPLEPWTPPQDDLELMWVFVLLSSDPTGEQGEEGCRVH
jgi:hypothetical protein